MNHLMTAGLIGLLCAPIAHAVKPEFIAIQVPPGKSAADLKPRVEARAEQPVVLELRAHRHSDGSLRLQCDEHVPPTRLAEDSSGAKP